MTFKSPIRRDERGAAAIEFAIAVPVLVTFIWGIFQIGLLLEANAGMQQALGEGARYATLYLDSTSDHRPTNAAIKADITNSVFKPGVGTFNVADPVDGVGYKDLSVTYTMPMDFLMFQGPTVTISKSKRVYVVT
jgi:hypothetical protein